MAHEMTRREFAIAAGAAGLASFGLSARAKAADANTLRFIAQADLRVLDPIWTTAYITRNHGYMVFDTLFAGARRRLRCLGQAMDGPRRPRPIDRRGARRDQAGRRQGLHDQAEGAVF